MTNYNDANDVLMGGAGAPAWKFDGPGSHKAGTVTAPPQSRQEREYDPNNPGGGALKVFPSGDPIMGVFVEVQTGECDLTKDVDDGKRTFYIEGKRLKDAVRSGIRASGAPGLEVGGVLDVTLTHYDEPGDRRSGCNWTVSYTPAGNAALMTPEATPAAAAAPAAPVAAPLVAPPVAAVPVAAPVAAPVQAAPVAAVPDPAQLAAFQAWQASQAAAATQQSA